MRKIIAHSLPSGLYRRLRNFTASVAIAICGLYHRWGISPRPENNIIIAEYRFMSREKHGKYGSNILFVFFDKSFCDFNRIRICRLFGIGCLKPFSFEIGIILVKRISSVFVSVVYLLSCCS